MDRGIFHLTFYSKDRVVEQRDAYQNPIRYERDAAGRVQAVIDRNQARTDVQHNAFGDVERLIDPLGNNTRYTYDELGRRTAQINALAGVQTWRKQWDGLLRTCRNRCLPQSGDVIGAIVRWLSRPNSKI